MRLRPAFERMVPSFALFEQAFERRRRQISCTKWLRFRKFSEIYGMINTFLDNPGLLFDVQVITIVRSSISKRAYNFGMWGPVQGRSRS